MISEKNPNNPKSYRAMLVSLIELDNNLLFPPPPPFFPLTLFSWRSISTVRLMFHISSLCSLPHPPQQGNPLSPPCHPCLLSSLPSFLSFKTKRSDLSPSSHSPLLASFPLTEVDLIYLRYPESSLFSDFLPQSKQRGTCVHTCVCMCVKIYIT